MKINQFDIWLVDLNPIKGSEQSGQRPCLVIQTNAANNYGNTILIAPLTSQKTEKIYPYEVKITPSEINKIKHISKIKFDQIKVIDKQRLIEKIGMLEKIFYKDIMNAIKIIIDFDGFYR